MSTIEKMKKFGKEWKSEDGQKHRIYFNNLHDLYGLTLNRYGTGNISSAYLDGAKISNGKARRLATDLDFAKVYYDINAGKFGFVGLSDTQFAKITTEIMKRIEV